MIYRKLPTGIQDVLPQECRVLNEMKDRLSRLFSLCGFQPVNPASIEYYDTYAQICNAIPQEHLFKFTDSDGKLLVLRPDMTLSISRIAATKLENTCQRLCYFADKWDLQNAGGISSREVYQAGIECLGEEGAFSDAQAVAFAIESLKQTGLTDFIIDIGHVGYFKGILQESGLSESQAEEVRSYVNAKDTLNVERTLKRAGVNGNVLNTIMGLPTLFGGVEVLDKALKLTENEQAKQSISHLKSVHSLLVKMGYEQYIYFDLGTVKRLSYYSGMVFSALVKELGMPVLSGGRYDDLCDDFGKHIPAVGFAMGLKRILVALERRNVLPEQPPVALVVCEEGAEGEGYRYFQELTRKGKRAFFSAEYGKEGAKKYAADEIYFVTKRGVEKL